MGTLHPLRRNEINGTCACGWKLPNNLSRTYKTKFAAFVDHADVAVEMTCPVCGDVKIVEWPEGSSTDVIPAG